MSVQELVAFSNRYGSNPAYVLAGGGNTSFKDSDYLYVKGSGQKLADIQAEGFVKLDRAQLDALFTQTYSEDFDEREAQVLKLMMAARCAGEENKRPSVEALLHNIIPSAFVLHLHPTAIGGLVCGKEGHAFFEKLFADEAVWIAPTMPGYYLATVVRDAAAAFAAAHNGTQPRYIFLENHGVFTGADTVEGLDANWAALEEKLNSVIKEVPDTSDVDFDLAFAGTVAPAIRGKAQGGIVTFRTNAVIARAVADRASFEAVYPNFSPDHLVYCGADTLFLDGEDAEAVLAQIEAADTLPRVIGVKGLGVFCRGDNAREANNAAMLFENACQLAVYAESFGGGKPMPTDLTNDILNWEVEKYRKGVADGKKAGGRMTGKVCIVTGAAQGFGLGIAEELAAEGAYIIAADLNGEGAAKAAQSLCDKFGAGMAGSVAVNVGDEDAVAAMAYRTALIFGGIDVLVSNAGIAKSGGLEEMTVSTFELTTKINYTAFFLCTKFCSRVMKIQRRFDKESTFDIIQINSKSGLTGSNRNFAYAGSKFGGIGLVQSFALELVGDGIKVNAICPGNFFDGPLWSDPVKGLFVQYLNSGKVPGAKDVADVKKFYESKIPMHRGCYPRDVAVAIFYIVEQQYETGQAVPVTGGQEMLK